MPEAKARLVPSRRAEAGVENMAQKDVEQLIQQLGDFRLRSRAMRALVAMGDEAVEPLALALGSVSQEGARWAILRSLGELRATDAVPYIAPLLDAPHARDVAHDALVRIVGEDLGTAPEVWLKWASERSGATSSTLEPEVHVTGLSDERLMEVALKGCQAVYRQEAQGRFTIELPVEPSGARQEVSVNLSARDHEGSPICIVYANCGPASPDHYEYALRRNLRMPYGALAVHDAGGRPEFVMFNTLLREDMSPLELRKSIIAVAERAARVRQELGSAREPGAQDPETQ